MVRTVRANVNENHEINIPSSMPQIGLGKHNSDMLNTKIRKMFHPIKTNNNSVRSSVEPKTPLSLRNGQHSSEALFLGIMRSSSIKGINSSATSVRNVNGSVN